jgi:hypothetical protein
LPLLFAQESRECRCSDANGVRVERSILHAFAVLRRLGARDGLIDSPLQGRALNLPLYEGAESGNFFCQPSYIQIE